MFESTFEHGAWTLTEHTVPCPFAILPLFADICTMHPSGKAGLQSEVLMLGFKTVRQINGAEEGKSTGTRNKGSCTSSDISLTEFVGSHAYDNLRLCSTYKVGHTRCQCAGLSVSDSHGAWSIRGV